MKSFIKKLSPSKALLVVFAIILGLSLIGVNARAGIFGMGEYPGGKLRAVFLISEPNSGAPEREYTIEIKPQGDKFEVTETVSSPGRSREDVSTAFGASGGASAGGTQYSEEGSISIDLSPLSIIDDKNIELKPDNSIILPDGGRLVTEDKDTIAGLEVVMGIFTHSNYPDQRARFGFTDRNTRDLLLFPAFFELIEDGEVKSRIELVEFSYQS
ncbi:hypothetical protein KGY72_07605 [Candidatus Bipolaricaulota bacterium]|nr:hypothetical protein [Candidatus Bipolaricaulota bacterium]